MMKTLFFCFFLNFLIKKLNLNFFNIFIINNLFLIFFMFLNFNFFLNYYWNNINYFLGIDYVSFSLCLLNFWIMSLSIYSNNLFIFKKFNKNFMIIMINLTLILIMTFCSMNMLMFYIFFEISLIPIMMIIMGWGYQIDRIQASMYMLFYTLFGSLPLLMIMLYIYMKFFTLNFNFMMLCKDFYNFNSLLFFFMMISAFLIKLPMYLTHLWLPKAHVEAPVSGSMILAGIMLKLGSYGIYRLIMIFNNLMSNFSIYLLIISLFGSMISSLICLNQSDLKIIVAYSSVVHMSVLLAGILTLYNLGLKSSLMLMIAHGLCSSGMFLIVNINYERILTRNIFINKNLINIFPFMTLWWFLICSSNFSAPPSLNLLSEIMLFNSIIQWNYFLMILIILISFFSTCYSIFLYSFSQYGKMNYTFLNFKYINCLEILLMILHWMPLNLIFLNMNLLIY
uniref:NADH-ubiquinone oxidoreductase chain 4 n=1 Tax=Pseudognaptodon sp. QL-2014 TaxID=1491725 RepID=A0A0U1WEL6_9HYME|nr:NADH dehydrogenase subunit 4 [Pseudognaptodon sp. QL-2014]